MLLCGETPFGDEGGQALKNNILAGRYVFEPAEIWDNVSDEAKDFVKSLLVIDPEKRPSAEEAQQHPWIRSYHEKTMKDVVVSPPIVESLVSFKELPLAKRFMFEVISFALQPSQISEIRIEFEKFDCCSMGELSFDCLRHALGEGDGAMAEKEIEDIFFALKVGKLEPRVHWHEFIAACLKQCHVDDRNLRIAFDRMDIEHKGSISYQNMIQLIARDANEKEEDLMETWAESVKEYHCKKSEFTFEEFSRLAHAYI